MRLYLKSVQSSAVRALKSVNIPSPMFPKGSGELVGVGGATAVSISIFSADTGNLNSVTPATAYK